MGVASTKNIETLKMCMATIGFLTVAVGLQAAEITEKVRFDTEAKELKARTINHTFGENVKAALTVYADEVLGRWQIEATVDFENTGKKPLHFSCGVAFFNSKGKLLCVADFRAEALKKDEKWELAPGEKRRISKTIHVPFNVIGQIAALQGGTPRVGGSAWGGPQRDVGKDAGWNHGQETPGENP